jgi:hypothetical protein
MESKPTRRRRFTSTEREQLLSAYRRSGQTQRQFAQDHGLSLSCLVVWLRKFGRRPVPPPLLPLPGGLPSRRTWPAAYQIVFPGGHRLEVARGFEREELDHLCQILHRL